jgi:hypothetical protein
MVSRDCEQCGSGFTTSAAKVREGNGKFCSRRCFFDHRKATTTPRRGTYKTVHLPGHPLAYTSGASIWEHRAVLYDKIGPGSHHCFHCGAVVEWTHGIRVGGLVVDHLDNDKRNNSPENLVPSCNRCNCIVRVVGKMIADDELFVMDSGRRKRAVELICECGAKYLKAKSMAARSKYCSQTCAGRFKSLKRWSRSAV